MLEFGKTNKTNWFCCPCMFLLCCPCGVSLVLVSPWGDLDCFFVLLLLQFYILIILHSGRILSGWEAWVEHPWCRVVGLILPRCTKQSRTALFFLLSGRPNSPWLSLFNKFNFNKFTYNSVYHIFWLVILSYPTWLPSATCLGIYRIT